MSTIVFIEMPASGHINPTLPVVQELVRRGEHITYYATEEFQSQIEQTGATFQPYPARLLTSTDIATATQSNALTRVVGLILRATESLLPFLLEELLRQQPDVEELLGRFLKTVPRDKIYVAIKVGLWRGRQPTCIQTRRCLSRTARPV